VAPRYYLTVHHGLTGFWEVSIAGAEQIRSRAFFRPKCTIALGPAGLDAGNGVEDDDAGLWRYRNVAMSYDGK
jgi:hypothetical protein